MRLKFHRMLLCLTFGAALVGCSESGTWEDDARNFYRAWGIQEPQDVKVLHSLYWRSSHFTREEAYYFKFRPNEKLAEGFIANNSLKPAASSWNRKLCVDPPTWFAVGSASDYEAWSCPKEGACLLLRDRKTSELYFAGCQL